MSVLKLWRDPSPEDVDPNVNGFLQALQHPTVIALTGRDTSRHRVLVTLLHGNEPSGLEAVHQFLLSGEQPAVNVSVVLGSVHAAAAEPLFYHRMLPGDRDLNRCFEAPYSDGQAVLAKAILDYVRSCEPEAVIDLHNTSGSSPAFGVGIYENEEVMALTGLFVDKLIVTELRLGSLMEQEFGAPVVTVEAGGSADDAADSTAREGVRQFFTLKTLWSEHAPVTVIRKSRRLELQPHSRIDYADRPLHDRDITLRADVDSFNFRLAQPDEALGWLGEDGYSHLRIGGEPGRSDVGDFFEERDGCLFPRDTMQIVMATTRPDIAASDCLFYFVMSKQ